MKVWQIILLSVAIVFILFKIAGRQQLEARMNKLEWQWRVSDMIKDHCPKGGEMNYQEDYWHCF
jgi:hypothetical protein